MVELSSGNDEMVEFFRNCVQKLIRFYSGEDVCLFFLGLTPLQAQIVMNEPEAIVAPKGSWFDSNGFLDLSVVNDAKTVKKTVLSMCSIEGVRVGLYEHFLRMRGSLSDLYDGKIIVVENNLFADLRLCPVPAPPEYLSSLNEYFDHPDREASDKALTAALFYANVEETDFGYLAAPIRCEEEVDCKKTSLFINRSSIAVSGNNGLASISVPGNDYTSFKLGLCNGISRSVCFSLDENAISNKSAPESLSYVLGILDSLSVPYSIAVQSHFPVDEETEDRLLPYFKKYWGADKEYWPLKFYKNPDVSMEMTSIPQGQIAEEAVTQALTAIETQNSFQNIFVTAPTGAGKSMLFQLPAIYLAEVKNAVTIVVEPTKSLMKDQVDTLRSRGVGYATALNTDISFSDRLAEIDGIKNGTRSIVYLSPELLLSSNLEELIGDRKLGMLVIDEAHTVTLWGKDFRSDYWFLGDYLAKLRKQGLRFPVFCLTATAVYGGVDDVVLEVITELELGMPKLFLGNVRREDISFDIVQRNKADFPGPIDVVKTDLAVERIKGFINNNKHSLVYCPFRTHVNNISDACAEAGLTSGLKVMKYHAALDASYRETAQRLFKEGKCRTMICTKAFGMGIDVDDITEIYHFAPTGNLADYIQEIGRGARRPSINAVASIDFFPTDARYFAQLYGMSALSAKQLREIMKKLYATYASSNPRRQNFLISPESFTYLFGEGSDAVNKTKQALMMISKDLERKYGFPVVIVKSKPSYTKNYVCIPETILDVTMSKYGSYMKKVYVGKGKTLALNGRNKFASEITVIDVGPIFEVNMAKLWEDHFSEMTFASFKWQMFNGDLLEFESGQRPSPRQRLEIKYENDFETVVAKFNLYLQTIESVFFKYKSMGNEFTARQFKKEVNEKLEGDESFTEFAEQVLAAFCIRPSEANNRGVKSTIRVLAKKSSANSPEPRYQVVDRVFISISKRFSKKIQQCRPKESTNSFVTYLSKSKGTREEFDLATLLELFGLATYEARGGDDAEIFIRLNDPSRVQALANDPRYRNDELARLNDRHRNSRSIITNFFLKEMNDATRWDMIEAYFLGNDDLVAEYLDLDNSGRVFKRKESEKTKKKSKKPETSSGILKAEMENDGMAMESKSYSDIWDYAAEDCENDWEKALFDNLKTFTQEDAWEKPFYNATITVPSTQRNFNALLAWPKSKVLLFLEAEASEYAEACETDWSCFLLTPDFEPEKMISLIKE